MTSEIATRLYELRKKHNLSQEELAEKLGVSRQAVSKWERSEASPDTDNLISLAKLYNLTLDELVFGEKNTENTEEATEQPNEKGSYTIEDGANRIKIDPAGVFVKSDDGKTIEIGPSGVKISNEKSHEDNGEDFDDEEYDDMDIPLDPEVIVDKKGNCKIYVHKNRNKKLKMWIERPYAILCVIAYLVFGFYNIFGGWASSWIIFITIPILSSFIDAICKKKATEFAYPILTALIYLYFGLYRGNWHSSWLIFISVPIYYSIAGAIDSRTKKGK